MQKGFTLIELIVTIAIIAVLSGIILFSITQYINRGRDSNIAGNLAVLVPAGEVFYNGNNSSYYNEYGDFCQNDVVNNAISQMPENPTSSCYQNNNRAGVCCHADSQSWAACVPEFTDKSLAFCVDSRGIKKDIDVNSCNASITKCQ